LLQLSDFKVKMQQNSNSARALPQTPLGELTALPQLDSRGPTFKGREKGAEGGEQRNDGSSGEGSGEESLEEVPRPLNFGPPAIHFWRRPWLPPCWISKKVQGCD